MFSREQANMVLTMLLFASFAVHVYADNVLLGDWVRYRPDFHDYAVGYNEHSTSVSRGAPAAIFFPRTQKEVQWFSGTFSSKYAFSVRSGGHSYEGLSSTPCSLTADTSNMLDIEIVDNYINYDTGTAIVKVGAGVRHDQLYEQLAKSELALPGANCMHVGVTGCTLGGCHGHLSASYGLTSDNVKSFEMVLANSTVLTVSESRHPALWWALRGGGGGDFGVVTSMEVEAKLVRGVVVYEVSFDYRGEDQSLVVELIENWQQWALNDLPNGTSAFLKCSSSFTCVARGVLPGRSDTDVQRAVRRLTGMFELEPTAVVEVMEHLNMQRRFSECEVDRKLAHKIKSLYFDAAIPPKVIDTGVTVLERGLGLPEVEWNGIEIQRVGFPWLANGASAADLYHQNQFLLQFSSSWAPSATEAQAGAHLEWMRELHMALAPTSRGAYRNFEDLDMGAAYYTHATWNTHPASFYYPADSVLAMEHVKLAYDPALVFKHPLSAAFQASEMEAFEAACRQREWLPRPAAAVEPAGEQPAPPVLVGMHVESAQAGEAGHLAEAARRLTHVVYSAVQPIPGGWVNISSDGPQGQSLKAFVQTVKDANPAAKRIIGVGGAGANASQWLWDELLESPWRRGNFGASLRLLLDEYDLDGVNVDWSPRWWHRYNFTSLLESVGESLGPDHVLIVHADITKTAVEQGYDVKKICAASSLVVLRAYDLEPLRPGSPLQWLTHLNANLFALNPALPSGAAGVATWIEAGAPREMLVLGTATYGHAYDVDGPPPDSAGRLDWRVRGKTAALTALSQTPGLASWAELHDALEAQWGTWSAEEVWELGGAAAWSEELGVWVGYDSPQTLKYKAQWIRSMGLAGGMLGPLHLDAYGEGKSSLADAFRAALAIEEVKPDVEDEESMVLLITLACVIPAVLLGCCIDTQLRRWGDIRSMHDGLTHVQHANASWNSKVHSSPQRLSHAHSPNRGQLLPLTAGDRSQSANLHRLRQQDGGDVEALSLSGSDGRQRRGSWDAGGRVAPKSARRTGGPRPGFFAPLARRFSTVSMLGLRGDATETAGSSQGGAPSPQLARTGSMGQFVRTGSMMAIQSAFDASMHKMTSHEGEGQWSNVGALTSEEVRNLNDLDLSRNLALLHQTKAPPNHEDGYDQQRAVVRYSRLLVRDAPDWLDNSENDFMNFYNTKRRGVVKLTCVVTMYAETPDLLERSLRGIAHGIHQLATETAFLRSWDEAVVVIVCDGLSKLPDETAAWLETMGMISRKLIEDAAKLDELLEGEKPAVALHCFEGLMQFEDWSPTQTMLVIKQENAGKLDSQRWAFIGVAERLMPVMPEALREHAADDEGTTSLEDLTPNELRALDRYLVTVDAGTQPMTNSLRELLIPMRYDPTIAGTCGHMIPDKTAGNILVQSQVFEYEHGHIVDKAMESMFGFITVLPGAYSAFRYDAIRRDQWVQGRYRREGPLVEYFKPLVQSVDSPALLNMGLAEDRFLCFALMVMKKRNYSLWYCRRAQAVTDVPDTLQSFLQQRRRWNNGAFFARLFTIQHYAEIFQGAGHGTFKLVGFAVQLLLTVIDAIFVWFAAALFYLWIEFNVERLGDGAAKTLGPSFLIMYLLAIVGHYDRRVSEIKWVHLLISVILALEILFCIGIFVYDQVEEPDFRVIAIVSFSFGAMFLCSLMQGKLFKMVAMMPGYLLMYPTFAILSQLYGFCHVHDVSWGTKGIETVHGAGDKEAQEREARVRMALSSFRFRILVTFIISNFVFGYVVGYFNKQFDLLLLLLLIVVGANSIRYMGSIAFTVVCWLDEMLQLTVLHGGIGREFGAEHEARMTQVERINSGDFRTAKEVFHAMSRRADKEQKRRRAEQVQRMAEEVAPVLPVSTVFGERSSSNDDADLPPPMDQADLEHPAGPGTTARRLRRPLHVDVPPSSADYRANQGLNAIPSPFTRYEGSSAADPTTLPSPLVSALRTNIPSARTPFVPSLGGDPPQEDAELEEDEEDMDVQPHVSGLPRQTPESVPVCAPSQSELHDVNSLGLQVDSRQHPTGNLAVPVGGHEQPVVAQHSGPSRPYFLAEITYDQGQ